MIHGNLINGGLTKRRENKKGRKKEVLCAQYIKRIKYIEPKKTFLIMSELKQRLIGKYGQASG